MGKLYGADQGTPKITPVQTNGVMANVNAPNIGKTMLMPIAKQAAGLITKFGEDVTANKYGTALVSIDKLMIDNAGMSNIDRRTLFNRTIEDMKKAGKISAAQGGNLVLQYKQRQYKSKTVGNQAINFDEGGQVVGSSASKSNQPDMDTVSGTMAIISRNLKASEGHAPSTVKALALITDEAATKGGRSFNDERGMKLGNAMSKNINNVFNLIEDISTDTIGSEDINNAEDVEVYYANNYDKVKSQIDLFSNNLMSRAYGEMMVDVKNTNMRRDSLTNALKAFKNDVIKASNDGFLRQLGKNGTRVNIGAYFDKRIEEVSKFEKEVLAGSAGVFNNEKFQANNNTRKILREVELLNASDNFKAENPAQWDLILKSQFKGMQVFTNILNSLNVAGQTATAKQLTEQMFGEVHADLARINIKVLQSAPLTDKESFGIISKAWTQISQNNSLIANPKLASETVFHMKTRIIPALIKHPQYRKILEEFERWEKRLNEHVSLYTNEFLKGK